MININIDLWEVKKSLKSLNKEVMDITRTRLDSLAKPINSLGTLEEMLVKCAGILGTDKLDMLKKCVVVMCADNGVLAQCVTDTPQEVTAIMTENFASGKGTVCQMAETVGADVIVVDIGVASDINNKYIINKKIAYGTRDMAVEPAMTREQVIKAIEEGIEIVVDLKAKGYEMIATGEMGIGNTTTSSAIVSVLLGRDPEDVTGKGASLFAKGIEHKVSVIKKAIALHNPDPNDPIDVLSKVGGLDIAGMAGLFIGGAYMGVPVIVDGFISGTAALLAQKIAPETKDFMLASHVSFEPGGPIVTEALGLNPILDAKMCLGEGTGAVATLPVYDMLVNVYNNMITYNDLGV